jgi:hypothetical protein
LSKNLEKRLIAQVGIRQSAVANVAKVRYLAGFDKISLALKGSVT